MFSLFKRKPAPQARPAVCDIPAHKGFAALVTLPNGATDSHVFPTLHAAQVYIMRRRDIARQAARAMGYAKPAPRAYRIRNLETGKFAAYLWQLTRIELSPWGFGGQAQ